MYKKFRLWLCKHLSWHTPIEKHHVDNDPLKFLVFAKCKWCGFEGQVDSQGNLF